MDAYIKRLRLQNSKAAPVNHRPAQASEPAQKEASRKEILRRPITELPARFRQVFPYVSFNHVQSLVYDTMFSTNKPIVVSAPTGSGKTGVFEMAIIKVIMDHEQQRGFNGSTIRIVYLAPTKALCSERREDWERKFCPFNLQCLELTSDASNLVNFKDSKKSSILLATPEKWDSITRSWKGHKSFVQTIRLLLVDEIHLVNDGPRGATLEAVISRMKTIRSLVWPTDEDNLRFIAVSATVTNVNDIADWFSSTSSKAGIYQVDLKERPVKLKTVVLGYTSNVNCNEFRFDSLLSHKLTDVIKEYSHGKPAIIFCATRKSAQNTAIVLVKEGKFALSFSSEKRNSYLKLSRQVKDKNLQEITRFGIAFHHAGLCASDRKLIETGFLDGSVMILCSTSTLALGVNLPAHLVVIKNTSYYDEGMFKQYSESSLVQMIGRAGRPQFDTEATAVIMTKSFCRDSIEKILTGKLVVDSQLHKFLTEHVNSEIVLGTITDDGIARKWMDSTFLRVRLMKSPENYGLSKTSSNVVKENTMQAWCKLSIGQLLEFKMISRSPQGHLESTDFGRAMARHYIRLSTMKNLMQLKGDESMCDLLLMICSSHEVVNDIQMRNEDKPCLSNLCSISEGPCKLRYPVNEKVLSREKKAFVLLQAIFGNMSISENGLYQESLRILRNAERVMACLKDVVLIRTDVKYRLLINILKLSQCFYSKIWEDSIFVSKQLEKIGAILSQNLASNGLITFDLLRKANPRNIEIFCNRLPPFGSNVQQTCFGLPIYNLRVSFRSNPTNKDQIQLLVEVTLMNGQDMRLHTSLPKTHESTLIVGNVKEDKLLMKHPVSDVLLLNRPDLTMCYGAEVDKIDLPMDNDDIECHLISGMFVGLDTCTTVKYVEPPEELC